MAHPPDDATLRNLADRLRHASFSGEDDRRRDELLEQLARASEWDPKVEAQRRARKAVYSEAYRFTHEEDLF